MEGAPLFIILGKLAGEIMEKEKQAAREVLDVFMSTAQDIAALPTTDEVEG